MDADPTYHFDNFITTPESSNVRGFRFERDETGLSGVLVVWFKGGKKSKSSVYRYYGVPMDTVRAFYDASSKGKFVAAHLKGIFPYDGPFAG